MRKPQGYAVITDPERPVVEYDTAACCHCGAAIFTKPGTLSTVYLVFDPIAWRWREEPGASCYHCWKPVCLACERTGICTPLEHVLQQLEAVRG